ncbi:MAG: bifunctional protein-serine/threonine kinase/phosphatase [Pseudomonadota bacterium]
MRVGCFSDKGRKARNQDYCDHRTPLGPALANRGTALALADGISTSAVSEHASRAAVENFLADFFRSPESWSIETAGIKALSAINARLYGQSQRSEHRFDRDRGYVCTFTALIAANDGVHIFHVGDARVYRLRGNRIETITREHRTRSEDGQLYLQRALGVRPDIKTDYHQLDILPGDRFVLATDGVHEHLTDDRIRAILDTHAHDPEAAARQMVEDARDNASLDNLTAQVITVQGPPEDTDSDVIGPAPDVRALPPSVAPRDHFDGYTILRELYTSARSRVYLATDDDTGQQVALKLPSQSVRDDTRHLERLMLEEWIARRIDNAHVLKAPDLQRPRQYVYSVTEYVEGRTLRQWMIDHPTPDLETVRELIEQIARGLQAFHRLEMLHQDLRPENVLIDRSGTARIIDFGATRVAGLTDLPDADNNLTVLGTAQYTAPEYFLGEFGTARSDQFSLAVITYELLSARLPYGTTVARAQTRSAQRKLTYRSVLDDERVIPAWIDFTLRKALNPDPMQRYDTLSEFVHDLRHPNQSFLNQTRPPLLERNPVRFWQGVSLLLFLTVLALLIRH